VDYTSGINYAREEGERKGKQEGIAIGEQRGKEETYHTIVRNAADKGISIENISEFTGLSVKTVQDILKNNDQ
jgi:predicted transposase/invertase (TIGR01784 family)